jgi:hypothetical protein
VFGFEMGRSGEFFVQLESDFDRPKIVNGHDKGSEMQIPGPSRKRIDAVRLENRKLKVTAKTTAREGDSSDELGTRRQQERKEEG